MISQNIKEAYSEIDEFLKLLDEEDRNKVPEYLRKFFKDNKDLEYVKEIKKDIPIKEQNLKEETLALIALLNLKYWCDDEEERQRLIKIYSENEEKYNEILEKDKSSDVIFKTNEEKEINNKKLENTYNVSVVKYRKKSFFEKLIEKIKKIFK